VKLKELRDRLQAVMNAATRPAFGIEKYDGTARPLSSVTRLSTAAVLNRIIQVVSAGLASTSLINLQLPCVKHRLEKRASFYSQRRRLYRQLYGHNIFMSVAARVTF